ncbi:MAG: hypothetical protein KBB37_02805 [Bacteroidia bacterium]|nr:hypothetical protein [Bacteroidia bacterium]MBP7260192.1 hypothetical protein [Bacteroidia bacterium]MBP9181081.1 hypothetical protein [Bacteroidia bacterium]MBP9723842.1 hypothetical protein [Bacteroidia bacterium]
MKYKIMLLVLLAPLLSMCQPKALYKQIIAAYEFEKGDTINEKILVTYLDSLKNVITTENNFGNATASSRAESDMTYSIIQVNTDRLYISADIDAKGDTVGKLIYIYDEKKNRIENYQTSKGDTINGQKSVYNESGKCIKLYNKQMERSDYYLSMEWRYDTSGNTLECKTYNESGQLIRLDEYENIYRDGEFITTRSSCINGGKSAKQFKQVKKGNITTTYYYKNIIGYNYGIKMRLINGGFSIKEETEDGRLKEWKIYDHRKRLIAHVSITEEQI